MLILCHQPGDIISSWTTNWSLDVFSSVPWC